MRRRFRRNESAAMLCFAIVSALLTGSVRAGIGEVTSVEGRVTASSGNDRLVTVEKGNQIEGSSIIATPPVGYWWSRLFGDVRLVLRPNSRIATVTGKNTLRLLKGGARISNIGQTVQAMPIRIVTPVGTVIVPTGTEMVMRYCHDDCLDVYPAQLDGLYLGVVSGEVSVENYSGAHKVHVNHDAVVYDSEASPKRLELSAVALEQDLIPPVRP